jgi:hypothetical protein
MAASSCLSIFAMNSGVKLGAGSRKAPSDALRVELRRRGRTGGAIGVAGASAGRNSELERLFESRLPKGGSDEGSVCVATGGAVSSGVITVGCAVVRGRFSSSPGRMPASVEVELLGDGSKAPE